MGKIAIVGAGMAGAAAARRLSAAGYGITIFDKSRGVGGRLATRRSDLAAFDHGAPVAEGSGAAFAEAMRELGDAAEAIEDGWRGRPGMSALLKPWVRKVAHRPGVRIQSVEEREGVYLRDEEGGWHGPFDFAIVTVPAPQLRDLCPSVAPVESRMQPVWTVMAAWQEGRDGQRPAPVAPLVSVHEQRKSGAWVAHADGAWSRENLERSKEEVARDLSAALKQSVGRSEEPGHVVAHRWRYGLVEVPLGQPFLTIGEAILAGGDWALGPTAEHAFLSGTAMADAVIDALSATSFPG